MQYWFMNFVSMSFLKSFPIASCNLHFMLSVSNWVTLQTLINVFMSFPSEIRDDIDAGKCLYIVLWWRN